MKPGPAKRSFDEFLKMKQEELRIETEMGLLDRFVFKFGGKEMRINIGDVPITREQLRSKIVEKISGFGYDRNTVEGMADFILEARRGWLKKKGI